MEHSERFLRRCQQRGLHPVLVEMFKTYGSHFKQPGGAEGLLFDGKAVDRATKDLKKLLQMTSKLKGRMIILSGDGGQTITNYIRNKKIRTA
jgi:hypothetical protein